MKNINYNTKVLNLIEKLSFINKSILIRKSDGEISILSADESESICYVFKTPEESFDFDGDLMAFFNYSEFYKLFSVQDEPNILQDEKSIILKKDRSKIHYRATDPEIVNEVFEGIDFYEPEIKMTLTSTYIKKIKSMASSGMLDADRLKISAEGNKLNFTLWNIRHENTFEDELKNDIGVEDEFEFNIFTEVFNLLPEGDYTFSVKSEGIVEFALKSEDVDLRIYTAEVENDD